MINKYKLHIGTYGWIHKSWENSFYPDDLPQDWQFAYYANEYSVIMIPWLIVQDKLELLKQGVEDSESSCRLLFEIKLNNINTRSSSELHSAVQEFLAKISFAGSRCLGIVFVVQDSDINNLSTNKLELVEELLNTCQLHSDTCLELQGNSNLESADKQLTSEFSAMLTKANIGLCRENDINMALAENNAFKLNITFCNLNSSDTKLMRRIVENSLAGECEASTNVLIFRSDNPNHGQMNTASVISDLL